MKIKVCSTKSVNVFYFITFLSPSFSLIHSLFLTLFLSLSFSLNEIRVLIKKWLKINLIKTKDQSKKLNLSITFSGHFKSFLSYYFQRWNSISKKLLSTHKIALLVLQVYIYVCVKMNVKREWKVYTFILKMRSTKSIQCWFKN